MGWTIIATVRVQMPRRWWIFATLRKTHSEQLLYASGSVLLIVASNSRGFVARYTLNKLDTSSNEIWLRG